MSKESILQISQYSGLREITVDIDMLIISKSGIKFMKLASLTRGPSTTGSTMEPIHPTQIDIY